MLRRNVRYRSWIVGGCALIVLMLWGTDRAFGGQPYIRIFNHSGMPLHSVAIVDTDGGRYSIGFIDKNGSASVILQVQGETSVTLSFQASNTFHKASSDYVESGGGYCIDYVVTPTLDIETDLGVACFRLGRVL